MRVLLIHSNKSSFGQLPKRIEQERGLNPPISLAYLASSIQNQHQVRILDMDAEKISEKQLLPFIQNFMPDIIGFQIFTYNMHYILGLIDLIKNNFPEIIIVTGGIQLSLYPEHIIKNKNVNYGVIGEGEYTFSKLLNAISKHENCESVPGIIFRRNDEIIRTETAELEKNIDNFNLPARELLRNEAYTSLISTRKPITLAFTSRGCPFTCSFCYRPEYWRTVRYHSAEYVVKEFSSCENLGIKEILVYDDNFTMNRRRAIEISNLLIQKKMDLTWDIRTRVDLIDEELLNILWKAGCKRISYGIESGDEHILELYNKKIDLLKAKEVFKMTKAAGFEILAYFMIGAPGETKNSVKKTLETMIDLDPDYLHLTHLIPYPNTKMFEIAVSRGILDPEYWVSKEGISYNNLPLFTDGELSRDDIMSYIKKGYRKFYYRPKYILGRIKKVRNLKTFWNYAKAALSLS